MEITRNFKKITKNNVDLAGGKGASLGEMTNAGISIPPGFVILSGAFEEFIGREYSEGNNLKIEIDGILDTVNPDDINTVEQASEKIQSLIINAETPENIEKAILESFKDLDTKFVAVRSSATAEDSASAAWAGQLNTYLNTTNEDILKNVKKCWASLFTPRAIFYRFEQKLQKQKVSVAVVIQKMVNSEESGISFSVHPVTQDYNHIIIEAGLGLGESIVSGQITPDSYIVDKQDWKIIDKNISEQSKALYRKNDKEGGNIWKDLNSEEANKQVITDEEVIKLAKLIKKIEDHYGFPVDVEWARENNQIYITQSRPITTLTELSNTDEQTEKLEEDIEDSQKKNTN